MGSPTPRPPCHMPGQMHPATPFRGIVADALRCQACMTTDACVLSTQGWTLLRQATGSCTRTRPIGRASTLIQVLRKAEEEGRGLTGSKTAEESRPEGAICDALRQHKFHSHAHESVSRATCGHSSRHAHPCAITRISFSTHRRAREYATWQSRSEDGLAQARPSRHTNTRSRPSRSYSTSPRPVASSTSASSARFLAIVLVLFSHQVPALFSQRMNDLTSCTWRGCVPWDGV